MTSPSPSPSPSPVTSDASSLHYIIPEGKGREELNEARANELLKQSTSSDGDTAAAAYTHVSLSGKSFTIEAARIFAPFLSSLSNLRVADLSDILSRRNTEEAIAVLDVLCDAVTQHQLEAVNLSDNAIGARGVHAVCKALKTQKKLQRVSFNNDGLQGESIQQLVEALLYPYTDTGKQRQENGDNHTLSNGITELHISPSLSAASSYQPTHLTHMEMYRNLLSSAGPAALAPLILHSPALEHFVINSSRMSSSGAKPLCQALATLSSLRHLNLSDNTLGSESGLILAHSLLTLDKTQHLTYLNLGDISVDEAAMSAIIQALQNSCVNLQHLDLQCNDISSTQAHALAHALSNKTQLRSLILENNPLKNTGVKAIVAAMTTATHSQLEVLNFNDTQLTSKILPSLLSLLRYPQLQHVYVNRNHFNEDMMERLKAAVEKAGKEEAEMLGSLSENDEDEEEEEEADRDDAQAQQDAVLNETDAEEEEGEGEEEKDEQVDALADELAQTGV